MDIRDDVKRHIEEVDAYSQHRLSYKNELSVLLHISRSENKIQVFDDLIFHAKYVWKMYGIMKRTPPDAEAYPKLSYEFKEGVERIGTLIRTLVKEAPDDIKNNFMEKYFKMTQGSLENLIMLSHDLAWIKNWRIDKEKKNGDT